MFFICLFEGVFGFKYIYYLNLFREENYTCYTFNRTKKKFQQKKTLEKCIFLLNYLIDELLFNAN